MSPTLSLEKLSASALAAVLKRLTGWDLSSERENEIGKVLGR